MAKAISAGRLVDLALAYSLGEGTRPAATCKFKLDECSGTRRDFILGYSNALAASTACRVADRWFPPHLFFILYLWGGRLRFPAPSFPSLLWPACWIDTPDRSSSSVSSAVQDAWDVYWDELGVVPPDVVLALRDAVSRSSVDDVWSIRSKNMEAGLCRAYCRAGGPTAAGSPAFPGRGLLRIRSRCLGGRSCRMSWASQGDEIDVHCAQYSVHSSLSPVVLFRGRLKSVADVLKGIRSKGSTLSRWDALWWVIGVLCVGMVLVVPISSLTPWDNWIPPDLHGFFWWVFDSLELLIGFLKQVVVSCRDVGVRKWTNWLRF